MIAARTRFEEWCGLHAPDLPADPIDAMQLRLARWEVRQPFWRADAVFAALGCCEEVGERASADSPDDVEDAVGDIAIYAGQVAIRNRLAMSELFDAADGAYRMPTLHSDKWRNLCDAQGRVAHLALKRSQRIREGAMPDEEYRVLMAEALAALLAAVESTTYRSGRSARDCYLIVGARILARDWNANRSTGVAP